MKATSSTESSKKKASTRSKKPGATALAACPTGAAGWCSYPFSPAQLERRMKQNAKKRELEETSKGKSSS